MSIYGKELQQFRDQAKKTPRFMEGVILIRMFCIVLSEA